MELNLSQLIKQAQNGDKTSFGKIYSFFYQRIYRYCYMNLKGSIQAQDICQETFLKAWKALPNFKETESGTFQAFLFRIARNSIYDLSKKKKELPLKDTLENEVIIETHLEEVIDKKDDAKKLKVLLSQLSEIDKQIILLRFFEELSYHEVAQILELKEGALRIRVHRILKKLKTNWQK